MDWKNYWDKIGSENTNLIAQVQRNQENETFVTAEHIEKSLDIGYEDVVLDVCCGNGLLTNLVAEKCRNIIGIDQSEKLILVAKNNFEKNNCSFLIGSALEIPTLVEQKFDKIYLEFSFQYFDKKNEGEKVIRAMLDVLKPHGQLLIGDIPEKGKENKLYNSFSKKIHHHLAKLKGTNSMGKFWSAHEIYAICEKLKVDGRKLTQPDNMAYSHYRFDFLITK